MALVKYNNNSLSAITAASSLPTGAMTLIKEQTASSSSTISFVDGTSDVVLDDTYPIYVFKFYNIHPATDQVDLMYNFSVDTGSNYNVTKTSTKTLAYHKEDGSDTNLQYNTALDIAQGTGFDSVVGDVGNENDESASGAFYLFSPSSTTFIKHYLIRGSLNNGSYAQDEIKSGYANTTSAIDAVQFKMASGNIDAGTIKLYGIKDS